MSSSQGTTLGNMADITRKGVSDAWTYVSTIDYKEKANSAKERATRIGKEALPVIVKLGGQALAMAVVVVPLAYMGYKMSSNIVKLMHAPRPIYYYPCINWGDLYSRLHLQHQTKIALSIITQIFKWTAAMAISLPALVNIGTAVEKITKQWSRSLAEKWNTLTLKNYFEDLDVPERPMVE